MAFDFYCREYLKVRDARLKDHDFSAWRMVSLMQYQLRGLCALMLSGDARISRLIIIKDGVPFEFSGSLPTRELEKAISGMAPADELEMRLECAAASGDADTAGIMDELEDMAGYEDVSWEDIRFECFTEQCGNRHEYRYGIWDGNFFHGEILPEPAS